MHTGMLWLSTDANKPLSLKIQEAADYYVKKYGRQPDLVLAHPSMITDYGNRSFPFKILLNDETKITVRPYRPVLPGHIWIGIEDKE